MKFVARPKLQKITSKQINVHKPSQKVRKIVTSH